MDPPSDNVAEMDTNEMKLLEFPDEILLEIFRNLSDHSLIQATNVCKRFKRIAGATVAKKYSGTSLNKFYSMVISGENCTDEQKQYEDFFQNVGSYMKAIDIEFENDIVAKDHWLIFLIQRHCKSLRKVNIAHGKRVDLYSIILNLLNLTELSLNEVEIQVDNKWTQYTYSNLVRFSAIHCKFNGALPAFFDRNPQLEYLRLSRSTANNDLCTINDKLKHLKQLELFGDNVEIAKTGSTFAMDSLKSLSLRIDEKSIVSLLTSIGSIKRIEELQICVWRYYELNVLDIQLLTAFNKLKTLNMNSGFKLSFELLQMLIKGLPNLEYFSLAEAGNLCTTPDDLSNVVSICHKLTQLMLDVGAVALPKLDYSFCIRFADIMAINGSNLKLELFSEPDTMVFTRDEAQIIHESYTTGRKYYRTLHWNGYATSNPSSKKLLELNVKLLKKIVTFVDGNALLALFQTCTLLQRLVIEHFTENNVFHCAVTPSKCLNGNVFVVLGEYINRICVDMAYHGFDDDDDEDIEGSASNKLKTKLIECVNQYCGHSLTEMEIDHSVQIRSILHWPNLRKLKIDVIDSGKVQLFQCPQLTHLTIESFVGHATSVSVAWANGISSLTSLRFGNYDESVEAFLCGLNGQTCNQMKNLHISASFEENERRRWLKLTNIIARFGHLVELHLNVNGIEESNCKFLFENCSMLVKLTICCNEDLWDWKDEYICSDLFINLKQNCKQIEVIQLIGETSHFHEYNEYLQLTYSMFPKVIFNLIDSNTGNIYLANVCNR